MHAGQNRTDFRCTAFAYDANSVAESQLCFHMFQFGSGVTSNSKTLRPRATSSDATKLFGAWTHRTSQPSVVRTRTRRSIISSGPATHSQHSRVIVCVFVTKNLASRPHFEHCAIMASSRFLFQAADRRLQPFHQQLPEPLAVSRRQFLNGLHEQNAHFVEGHFVLQSHEIAFI